MIEGYFGDEENRVWEWELLHVFVFYACCFYLDLKIINTGCNLKNIFSFCNDKYACFVIVSSLLPEICTFAP